MESREFAKYHTWCDNHGIRVYPQPRKIPGEFNLVVERNKIPTTGKQIFYDKPIKGQQCVWKQIGILLKIIYDNESLEVEQINKNHRTNN